MSDEIKRKYDLSSMISFTSCGAPCAPAIKKGVNEVFMQQGCKRPVFCEYCDAVETMHPSIMLIPDDYIEKPERIESVGKPRCCKARIVDPETGEVCPANKDGILYQRTMGVFQGWVPETTKEIADNAMSVIDGETYINTGLIAHMDEDGYVYLTGRKKEMIITGGVNVYPNEGELCIIGNPKVADVAIIPIPDEDLGEVMCAVVELKEGEKATEEEIIDWCKKSGLYGYRLPKKVDFWKKLPRDPDGKMLKAREIMPKYWEEKGIKRGG